MHLLEAYKPLVEHAAASVLAAAVSSMMAPDVLIVPRERGHHLGTVELTDYCTLEVRVGAGIDMRSRGRAMRGRARYNKPQKSSSAASERFVRDLYLPDLESALRE